MMGYAHFGGGFLLTKLFCLLFFLGVVLFIVWAIRALDKKQLRNLVIGLLVVGFLGMVGSSLLMKTGEGYKKDWKSMKFGGCEKVQEVAEEASDI